MQKDLRSKVIYCLSNYPETRNCDIKLTIKLWKEYYPEHILTMMGDIEVVRLDQLKKLPSQDRIKRWRAHIQNVERTEEFLPDDPEVIRQRGLLRQEWYIAMQPSNPARG